MKALLIGLLTLTSVSSFAATYTCNISVLKNGKEITEFTLETHRTETTLGTLSEAVISTKKNLLGKEKELTIMSLNGYFSNNRITEDGQLDARIILRSVKQGKREELEIAHVTGQGNFEIQETNGEYEVEGSCLYLSELKDINEAVLNCSSEI